MSDLYPSESGSAYLQRPLKAAMYLRTATTSSDQLVKQTESISAYAKLHEIEIVATYEDYAKGGLTTEGREGLQRLIHDISSGSAPFSILLMQDISRWGRFQNIDERRNYDYLCQKAGIQITYIEEPIEKLDTSPVAIINALGQIMAGKYSR